MPFLEKCSIQPCSTCPIMIKEDLPLKVHSLVGHDTGVSLVKINPGRSRTILLTTEIPGKVTTDEVLNILAERQDEREGPLTVKKGIFPFRKTVELCCLEIPVMHFEPHVEIDIMTTILSPTLAAIESA